MSRILNNLLTTSRALKVAFPAETLDAIEAAIRDSEHQHSAEIQFAIESSLHIRALLKGVTARDEAIMAFSQLGTWDTAENNGVLVYILLAEKDIEIIADRGCAEIVSDDEWRQICKDMETYFAAEQFLEGSLLGINAITEILIKHFPPGEQPRNERPNRPVFR